MDPVILKPDDLARIRAQLEAGNPVILLPADMPERTGKRIVALRLAGLAVDEPDVALFHGERR